MSLRGYADMCAQLVSELVESMNEDDIEALRCDILALGSHAWYIWKQTNLDEIHKFLEATPGSRTRPKKWKDPVLRGRLLLAAANHLNRARTLLQAAEELSMQEGEPYRKMGRIAGDKFSEVVQAHLDYWPFEHHGDPFRRP